jgi:hypothetical protein
MCRVSDSFFVKSKKNHYNQKINKKDIKGIMEGVPAMHYMPVFYGRISGLVPCLISMLLCQLSDLLALLSENHPNIQKNHIFACLKKPFCR